LRKAKVLLTQTKIYMQNMQTQKPVYYYDPNTNQYFPIPNSTDNQVNADIYNNEVNRQISPAYQQSLSTKNYQNQSVLSPTKLYDPNQTKTRNFDPIPADSYFLDEQAASNQINLANLRKENYNITSQNYFHSNTKQNRFGNSVEQSNSRASRPEAYNFSNQIQNNPNQQNLTQRLRNLSSQNGQELMVSQKLQNSLKGFDEARDQSQPVKSLKNNTEYDLIPLPQKYLTESGLEENNSANNIYTEDFKKELNERIRAVKRNIREKALQQKLANQKSSNLPAIAKARQINKFRRNFQPQRQTKNKFNLALIRNVSAVLVLLGTLTFGLFSWNSYNLQNTEPAQAEVQGVNNDFSDFEEYRDWIVAKNDNYSEPEKDLDADGLTNYEEFLIQSEPLDTNSCSPEKTDIQNLLELIDPSSCEPIDTEDPVEVEKFNQVIEIETIKKNFLEKSETEVQTLDASTNTGGTNLLALFGIDSYSKLDTIDLSQTEQEINKKEEYLQKINKIDEYIKKYRSFEAYDRNYAEPVHPAVYLETSINYNVELKYVLAVARKESRFGTDRYDSKGNLTRPGKYQNIYSIGLDDSGNNLGYKTWEEGVEAFGKWYQSYDKRGISDCRKWRIYNPNGDYCQTIENLATEVEAFLNS